LRTETR